MQYYDDYTDEEVGRLSAALDAIIPLKVQDATGKSIRLDAVLDTGFTGEMVG